MAYSRKYIILTLVGFVGLLLISILWSDKHYLLMSFILVGLSVLPFYFRFESRQVEAGELVLIAMLAAIAAVGRVPFASLPSVQPTSFVIIMSAIVLGREAGFMIGSTAATVSNIFLGQGPWTPWQMLCWGLIGLTAGMLKDTPLMKNKYGIMAFGFVWGFLFGWIMNIWFILFFESNLSWSVVAAAYIASFKFDLNHALSNIIFVAIFGDRLLKILNRVSVKYGFAQEKAT